jgi:hypothetical protein
MPVAPLWCSQQSGIVSKSLARRPPPVPARWWWTCTGDDPQMQHGRPAMRPM